MIIYEGSSLVDGVPIVAIATPDHNPKTGEMLYTWIILQDESPEVAAFNGNDRSICGDCKFRAQPKLDARDGRPAQTRTCYVHLTSETADEDEAPADIWRKYWEGGYRRPAGMDDALDDWQVVRRFGLPLAQYVGPLPVRVGSYGDPAAVPTMVWRELLREVGTRYTGYTHLWRTCDPDLREFCMASVDNPKERDDARGMGWRTFLVVPKSEAVEFEELNSWDKATGFTEDILCPATSPRIKADRARRALPPVTCASCLLCNGTGGKAEKSIWEKIHGVNQENHTWD